MDNLPSIPSSKTSHPLRKGSSASQGPSSGVVATINNIVSTGSAKDIKVGFINMRSMRHKLVAITEILEENSLDLFFICETWLHDSEKGIVGAALPKCYSFIHVPRSDDPSITGGGVAIIFRNCFSNFKILSEYHINDSFESLVCTFYFSNHFINTAVVYRPGHPGTDMLFMQEFNEFISSFSELGTGTHFFICGDFNYWVDNPSDKPSSLNFIEILDCHNCINSVRKPTHIAGHILDLVIHDSANTFLHDIVVHPVDAKCSDHSLITFCYSLPLRSPALAKIIKFRNYKNKNLNLNILKHEITTSLSSSNLNSGIADLVTYYNSTLSSLHDIHFPLIEKTIMVKESSPWFDSSIAALRKDRRKAERRWRRKGTELSRLQYVNARSLVNSKIEEKKKEYFNNEIKNCNTDQKKLWNVISKLAGCVQYQYPSKVTPDEINKFFINKVETIRSELDEITYTDNYSDVFLNFNTHHSSCEFNQFNPITESDVVKLVNSQNKTSCSLDPFNISKVPEVLPLLTPIFTKIINACFSLGVFPSSEKLARVKPLLKKPSLDLNDLKNYRPVSNLTFLSKLIEKAILNQLIPHFNSNKCISDFQSAYRQHHSTETALCRIYNDLLHNIQNSNISILILLDLSAAFDTIDHKLLLKDLEQTGIKGNALLLLESYLTEREQEVSLFDSISIPLKLRFGVPQGSVLGPVLFSLYSSKLSKIMAAHGVNYHLYADDTQIYLPISDITSCRLKITCIMSDIKLWMLERKLKLNEGKTEVILINGTLNSNLIAKPDNFNIIKDHSPSNSVRDLGFVIDSKLSFKDHFNFIIKSCNYQLRRLSSIIKYLDIQSATTVMHAFITSRVDYCNSLFVNLPKKDLTKLQTILNRAARLIFNLAPFTPTSSYLYELHWLPIKARIEFKLCLLVYKALKFNQPTYIYELFTRYKTQSNSVLRAADDPHLLIVPRLNKLSSFGSRAISYAGPLLFNKLPSVIKNATSTDTFKKLLKTYLFKKSYDEVSKSISLEYKT